MVFNLAGIFGKTTINFQNLQKLLLDQPLHNFQKGKGQ